MDQNSHEFPDVDQQIITNAHEKALTALSDEDIPQQLAEYYNPERNFSGATFATLEPNDPNKIDATDLLATRTLNVPIPVISIRRFLENSATRQSITDKLAALPSAALESTSPTDFDAMEDFYGLLKELLAPAGATAANRWVTASKLAARKKPSLFPVRDNVVCNYLGISKLKYCAKDWLVFRTLMNSPEIQGKLEELPNKIRSAAGSDPVHLDHEPLRLLDAALWRYAA